MPVVQSECCPPSQGNVRHERHNQPRATFGVSFSETCPSPSHCQPQPPIHRILQELYMDSDPLDDVLSLEDKYYSEGHALGVSDGSRAGRIEGRIFGLEKGFEKFVAMGALGGRSTIWASRIVRRASAADGGKDTAQVGVETVNAELSEKVTEEPVLPQLADNWRLERHIRTLYALTEPVSLSTQNNEDAVSDFDDRIKRAEGKAKVIEKIIGESNAESDPEGNQPVRGKKDRRPLRTTGTGTKTESNMEDFGGRRARS